MKFGLDSTQLRILEDLVVNPLKRKKAKVWIFGSRAKGTAQPFSDVDLMYEPSEPLPKGFIFEITTQLEESNFNYKLDLVERNDVALSYKENIQASKIEI